MQAVSGWSDPVWMLRGSIFDLLHEVLISHILYRLSTSAQFRPPNQAWLLSSFCTPQVVYDTVTPRPLKCIQKAIPQCIAPSTTTMSQPCRRRLLDHVSWQSG